MTHTRAEIRRLLDSVDAHPSRALGQNFVCDANTVRRIVRLAGVDAGDHVVEIGAGLGSLTLALAEAGAHVVAVEADRRLTEVLRVVVQDLDVDVVGEDALTLDWATNLSPPTGWRLVANLPYNIATGLVLDVLAEVPAVDHLLVMVQREVGERLAAEPGSRIYGIPSVKAAYWASASVVGSVPPSVFHPVPRVDSALVRLDRRLPPDVPFGIVSRLVEAGFGQRRKMLRGALSGVVDPGVFAAAGVDPTARAESLGIDSWCALARHAPDWRPTAGRGKVDP